MSRTLRTLALAVVATLTLSGCLKMEMSFTLHEDDTVDGSIVMAIQKGVGEAMGMSDEDLLAELDAEGSFEDIEGGSVEPYDDGEFAGTTVTFTGQPLSEISEEDEGITIVREGDEFVVGGEFDTGGEDMSMLTGATMTLAVTFPGEVSEHNGTLEGTTVTWDLLTQTEPMSARGAATAGGSGLPVWLWAVIGAVVLAGAAAAVIIVTRRRSSEDAATEGEDAAVEPEVETFAPAPTAGEDAPVTEPIAPTVELPTPEATIEEGPVEGTGPEEDNAR
ncbi:LppM family (lipo)protein [Demequina mangrovi]|uniref:LppM domain-containing protein n=1 Tax=Demequina mangrovi TaxID=1043493 RepID=A0A1H7AXD7_9MICO|nr:hypothetical protein [Demequina mangrovi]SEJ66782.1 hypothetical protein SAMN05421637_2617 [Demequina mangrovi]